MNRHTLSTFCRLTQALALVCSCLTVAACSGQKNDSWFNFGHKSPNTTPSKDQDPEPTQPTLQPVSQSVSQPTSQPISQSAPSTQTPESPNPDHHALLEKHSELQSQAQNQAQSQHIDEILQLYRRLHVESDPDNRSALIIELLNDSREQVRLLGFDLASRDLSSGSTLTAAAANTAVILLSDQHPTVRSGAARLITRLALPDAMTLLTSALASEQNPLVAESLLQGLQRWPNPNAKDDILRWYQTQGPARIAAANAAWSLADLDQELLIPDAPILRKVYQSLNDQDLTDADMRLIAVTGTTQDINRLIALARDPDYAARFQAAQALSHTPRGVDPLIDLATNDPAYFSAAASAITRHRLNPQGISHLTALPSTDHQARTDTIIKACDRLDLAQLADAVRLARTDSSISDELSIRLLNRLVAGAQTVSPRSAPGIIMLADLELRNKRPDRSIEILSLLPATGIDPASTVKANNIKTIALILLTDFEAAAAIDLTAEPWITALSLTTDLSIQLSIATEILARSIPLSDQQSSQISTLLSELTPNPDPEPKPSPAPESSQAQPTESPPQSDPTKTP